MELWTEKLDLEIWLLLSSPEWCKDKVGEMDKPRLRFPARPGGSGSWQGQCICRLGTIL